MGGTGRSGAGGAAVVVGSAGAVGGAILRGLAADRPELVPWITYRSDPSPLERLGEEIPGLRSARCDLVEPDSLAGLVSQVEETAGAVSVLVHAAVAPRLGPMLEVGHRAVSESVASGGLSLLALVEAFDRLLEPGSAVLYLTSIGSQRVIPGYGSVGAAKAVGDTIVRYLASELAPRGIRVNAISAGPFLSKAAAAVVGDTGALMAATAAATPRGRALDLEELANAAVFLAGPRGTGITGQVVVVDGGIFNRWVL